MRRSLLRLALCALLVLPAAVVAAEWTRDDVEAAARYREVERERAQRYRAEVARRAPSHEAAEPVATAEVRPPRGAREDAAHGPRWWERAGRAVAAELDLEALGGAADAVAGWWGWWREEVSPRVASWRRWVEEAGEGTPVRFADVPSRAAPSDVAARPARARFGQEERRAPRARVWWSEERERLRRAGLGGLPR